MASPSGSSSECSKVIDHNHVPEFEVATWIKITLILVYVVIFVVGILGNSITIRVTQVLQKKGYLQKEVTDHMVSLACSDILVFLIGMPMEFYSIIWNPLTTPSYAVSCKLHTFLFEACSYATLLHVLTLSFERYVAICHPFRYKAVSGPCQVKLLIAFVWVTSALVALPVLFAMGIEYPLVNVPTHRGLSCNRSRTRHHEHPETSNMSICTNLSSRWTVFQSSIFGAFAVYLLVLVSVAFMCWNMMQVLMRSKQGTMAKTGPQVQLRKSESEESRTARRQTIIFLSESGWRGTGEQPPPTQPAPKPLPVIFFIKSCPRRVNLSSLGLKSPSRVRVLTLIQVSGWPFFGGFGAGCDEKNTRLGLRRSGLSSL
jgi:G protein-coupled receptor 39